MAWEIERQRLSDEVVQTQSGVRAACGGGPVVCCYPTGAWYAPVAPGDVAGIVERDLGRGEAVHELVATRLEGGVNHTDAFDEMLAEQPSDWATFEVYLTLDDPLRLNEARVALARANARPLRVPADHDFEITVANTHGHGARAGVVRSALRILDDRAISGRTWAGATRT